MRHHNPNFHLFFAGKYQRKVDEGRVGIAELVHGNGDELQGMFFILSPYEDGKRLRLIPYTSAIERFFTSLPENDALRVKHFEETLFGKVDSTSGAPRVYIGKNVNCLEVTVAGRGSYIDIIFPEGYVYPIAKSE